MTLSSLQRPLNTSFNTTRFGNAYLFSVADTPSAREKLLSIKQQLMGNKADGPSTNHACGRVDYDAKPPQLVSLYLDGKDNVEFHKHLRDLSSGESPTMVKINGLDRLHFQPVAGSNSAAYAFEYKHLSRFVQSNIEAADLEKFQSGQPITSKLGTTYQKYMITG